MSGVSQEGVCHRPERLRGNPGGCPTEQAGERRGTEGGHACLSEQEEQTLREGTGFVPGPLMAVSKRPGTLSRFTACGKRLVEDGPLSARERSLVTLSAATALKPASCIRAHSVRPRKARATDEEVPRALLKAGMIPNTSALHIAHESVALFADDAPQA